MLLDQEVGLLPVSAHHKFSSPQVAKEEAQLLTNSLGYVVEQEEPFTLIFLQNNKNMPALYVSWLAVAYLFFSLLSPTSSSSSRRETTTASAGVVSSDDGRCSRIGRDALRDGGHAVDAAVATALCLGVVMPANSGLGGGSFMLVRLANGKAQGFDMRGMAPGRARENMYNGNVTKKHRGPLSVAVPGELAGLHKAWKQYGKLPWSRVVEPAEKLARNGFRIAKALYEDMLVTESAIKADKGLRELFTKGGNLLPAGSLIRNTQLANTLSAISIHGPGVLYNGTVGANLVGDVRNLGGILATEDLQRYQAKLRTPISINVLGLKVIGLPPPTSGGATMMLTLNILAQYGFPLNVTRSLEVHRIVEAFKHAYAVRMNLGDPDFVDVKSVLSDMLSPRFAAALRKTISPNRTYEPNHYGSRWNQVHDHGTTHICVVDEARNAISMTTSVNSHFGAKILSPNTGIVLSNEMNDFSMPLNGNRPPNVPPPARPNFIRPYKRPLSSMTPTVVLKKGKLKALLGSAGGIYIPAAVTEIFINHFVKGRSPISSIMSPRFYHKLIPNVLACENWTSPFGDRYEFSGKTISSLQKKGHSIRSASGWTISQFVVRQFQGSSKGKLVAASDPRRGGVPAGY